MEATHPEICRSSKVNIRNTVGVKGVAYDPTCPNLPYRCSITRNGITINLGGFATASECHQAYARAAKDLHGVFNPSSRLYNQEDEKND
jgi:hypothetical protein